MCRIQLPTPAQALYQNVEGARIDLDVQSGSTQIDLMDNLVLLGPHEQIQHEIEGFHRRPAVETGHLEEGLDRAVDSASEVAVNLDDSEEEVIGKPAFSFDLDPTHHILDFVEFLGVTELVDDQSVKGFVGFVVPALRILGQDSGHRIWVLEIREDFQSIVWVQPVLVITQWIRIAEVRAC